MHVVCMYIHMQCVFIGGYLVTTEQLLPLVDRHMAIGSYGVGSETHRACEVT